MCSTFDFVELVIAEKPSVARDLARVVGARLANGAYEGNGRVITWCVGHLVELEEPAAYDGRWKAWRFDTLPMLPAEFKLRPSSHATDQLKKVLSLLRDRRFQSVINACDAGREGELIFRYLLQFSGRTLPVKRLWISSLTDEAIGKGFAALRPGAQLDALADAARSRSEADWLVGLNATRAVTLKLRGGGSTLFSIGRVQTPTLAMLVQREREIEKFVPRDYWEVRGDFVTEKGEKLSGRWTHAKSTQLGQAALAGEVVARASTHARGADPKGPRVAVLEQKVVNEPPPQLFDLTTLQRTANRRFGFSAQRTLDLAQALYEKHKVLSYPRTDSRHVTADVAKELPAIVASLAEIPAYAPFAVSRPLNRRVVDDSKVSDHHAIIPTGKVSARLDRDEERLFDLVVRRFLGVFHADARFAVSEAFIRVGGEGVVPPKPSEEAPILEKLPPPPDWFLARGRMRVDAGWQAVAGIEPGEEPLLPTLAEGQPLGGRFVSVAKKTQPPRRYSEATLLSAMETAGRHLTDEALRAAMKDNGLGTPATRAAIIETLLKRGYVRRDQKLLVPTEMGLALIDKLPVPSLASPELTGNWEARLVRIARGQESRAAFMKDIGDYVRQIVAAISSATPVAGSAHGETVGRCPKCSGPVREQSSAYSCECGFAMKKNVAGRPIGAKLAALLLAKRKSQVLAGFRSKKKTRFSAALVLEDDGNLRFAFDGPKKS